VGDGLNGSPAAPALVHELHEAVVSNGMPGRLADTLAQYL
jgi:hypothetical protein